MPPFFSVSPTHIGTGDKTEDACGYVWTTNFADRPEAMSNTERSIVPVLSERERHAAFIGRE